MDSGIVCEGREAFSKEAIAIFPSKGSIINSRRRLQAPSGNKTNIKKGKGAAAKNFANRSNGNNHFQGETANIECREVHQRLPAIPGTEWAFVKGKNGFPGRLATRNPNTGNGDSRVPWSSIGRETGGSYNNGGSQLLGMWGSRNAVGNFSLHNVRKGRVRTQSLQGGMAESPGRIGAISLKEGVAMFPWEALLS